MATLRFPEPIWTRARNYLFGGEGHHFAFFLARWTFSRKEPVFMVQDVILIPDSELSEGWDGAALSPDGILAAVNAAVRGGACLIEAHNHGGQAPRFSRTDRYGFSEFVPYILDSLPNRPYAAIVWGDTTVYGEYFLPDGRTGVIDSLTVIGEQLRQIVSRDDDQSQTDPLYSRQTPWFTEAGQRQMGRLRVGIVGSGGTGAHVIQNLVYLGCREFVIIDHDLVEDTNLNRLVIATPADIGTPKVFVARRLIKSVAPEARVLTIQAHLQTSEALNTLKGVDVIFGCVDNDGARLVLNELAIAYGIPLIDLAVGLEADEGQVRAAGGRVAVVLPGQPCLHCMGEINPDEARYFLAPPEEQAVQVARGYIQGMDVKAPAVVALNGLVAAAAINEFAVLISGARPVNLLADYDLLGDGRAVKGQWMTPRRVKADPSCVECALAGVEDQSGLERYVRIEATPKKG